ncbi:MAG: endopeptidase La [Caldisericia bacterium]
MSAPKKWHHEKAPLLPLRNLVVFPGMTVPLIIGREKSIKAIEKANDVDRRIVCLTQKKEHYDNPTQRELFDIGVGCELLQIQQKLPDGNLRVIVEGIERVKVTDFEDVEGLTMVDVEPLGSIGEVTPHIKALMRVLSEKFEEYFRVHKRLLPEILLGLSNIHDPDELTNVIAANISIPLIEKQEILAQTSILERLEFMIDKLSEELEILSIQQKIDSDVKSKIDKTQREFYLREQLRSIEKELGESDNEFGSEIGEFRKKIEKRKGLPDYVVEKVNEQIEKLQKMPPMAAESAVIRNYIDWIFDLPWEKKTKDRLDVNAAQKILNEDHYDLEEVKERILEYLAVRKLSPEAKSPIICLVGPPGVGKTSLGKSVARAMNRQFVRMSLGGIKDEAEIRGHRRTYVGSMPGRIIQGMKQAGSSNPVFLLDEIDKVGLDFRGDPTSALLEALDPEQNTTFSDHYLEIPYDLSDVLFITTANVTHTIPSALFDRMEMIVIPGYTQFDKVEISKKFLIPKQLKSNGLTKSDLAIPDATINMIIERYTREAGLRSLERHISKLMRKVAKKKVSGEVTEKLKVTTKSLPDYLDIPVFKSDAQRKTDEVGTVTGLAVTEDGGEVLCIESTLMEGTGKLILTGLLGDVMKESATAAMSYVRTHRKQLKIPEDYKEDDYDLHIHFPEGAIPKDGPSAGIGIVTSIVSTLTNIPVSSKVAMTGEITLRGRVLPIGGVKQKVLAAHRNGIRKVILPKDNEPHTTKVPEKIRNEMEFIFVETIKEVIKEALIKK